VIVKEMTGGDPITARFLHAEFFEFMPEFKIFLAVNHRPVIKGTDHAIWRRIRLIPFTVKIPEEEQDRTLPDKLKAELPGIFNWALAGCLQWRYGGLAAPQAVVDATEDYRCEMDTLGGFLQDHCILAPGAEVMSAELFKTYQEWAEASGEKYPLNKINFGMKLRERGFVSTQETKGAHKGLKKWVGIGLRAVEA
jgi:putative DNA primase/helicase